MFFNRQQKQVTDIKNLSVSDVNELVRGTELLLLDVRTKEEYSSGHLKNAQNIPVQELLEHIDSLREWKDKVVLVYCHSGGRSSAASQILSENGFVKIYNMLGGISSWSSAGFQIVK